MVQGSTPSRGHRFFSSQNRGDRLWGAHSLIQWVPGGGGSSLRERGRSVKLATIFQLMLRLRMNCCICGWIWCPNGLRNCSPFCVTRSLITFSNLNRVAWHNTVSPFRNLTGDNSRRTFCAIGHSQAGSFLCNSFGLKIYLFLPCFPLAASVVLWSDCFTLKIIHQDPSKCRELLTNRQQSCRRRLESTWLW
jgi:hypothetical protein